MRKIEVLDQQTIDKIAAGEVVERPASVVKELVENSIDAGASAVTVEIENGGISFIRITDNGMGIPREQVPMAFLRHATSKIRELKDLEQISSLGFRGEALSSIAAVSQVELITKTAGDLTGVRYLIEGGREKSLEEVGAPEGTTFLIRNIFYNTPARAKFLKSPVTEAGYISGSLEQLALSHPEISFKYIQNKQTKLHTSGNGNRKEVIYQIYGREIARELLPVEYKDEYLEISGFLAKPTVSRGNRNFENYYVNGRYIKSRILMRAIEDGYKAFLMQHKYPFTSLYISVNGEHLDVNVHPTKMEVRFDNQEQIYRSVYRAVLGTLQQRELIPEMVLDEKQVARESRQEAREQAKAWKKAPEPFERQRILRERGVYTLSHTTDGPLYPRGGEAAKTQEPQNSETAKGTAPERPGQPDAPREQGIAPKEQGIAPQEVQKPEQLTLFGEKLLDQKSVSRHQIIGQVFDTYWLVQFEDKLYIIDQHAAHEKVIYERMMRELKEKKITSQLLSPPLIVSLTLQEEELLKSYLEVFASFGFEIEAFGGREYSIRAVPHNLYGIAEESLFLELLGSLELNQGTQPLELLTEKVASMSCKAAVKGNNRLSPAEARMLIDELLELENPYNCPHGRPTIISMSKYELEKKFKRIV
ncbi:MAG TPA: DNA mismatch repair endonuclease MutL [Candidatus Egerieimonas intestinavium]|uniref:DNA mismatch repair protein MutL n=1 Tax=Candidatus Egerieimonas intestinavium TaxID=2840777 RepID=A0A9D1EL79_9FIRM|nr:DNA mismatch repair endonuclease MutL [Candidatus Egerieimonas intestinavium]